MTNPEKLKKEIKDIKKRNSKVEADKAWETSVHRRFLIMILTYVIIVSFLMVLNLPKPFINAIVPTLGFVLSTLTIPVFKKLWIKYLYQK